MKKQQITAILLSAIMTISACVPAGGISAFAAETDEHGAAGNAAVEETAEDAVQDAVSDTTEDTGADEKDAEASVSEDAEQDETKEEPAVTEDASAQEEEASDENLSAGGEDEAPAGDAAVTEQEEDASSDTEEADAVSEDEVSAEDVGTDTADDDVDQTAVEQDSDDRQAAEADDTAADEEISAEAGTEPAKAVKGVRSGKTEGQSVTPGNAGDPSSDELFSYYVDDAFGIQGDGTNLKPKKVVGERLTGIEYAIYSHIANQLPAIAEGGRASTEFEIPVEELGFEQTEWDVTSLGVSSIYARNENGDVEEDENGPVLTEEAQIALDQRIEYRLSAVIDSLLVDYPYELYWYDKTGQTMASGMGLSCQYSSDPSDDLIGIAGTVCFYFPVVGAYAAGEYEVDTSIGQSVKQAADNAQEVLSEYSGASDYDKLNGYKQAICDRVAYNHEAVDNNADYGNPWQLIWVFDNDSGTDVVCEGYSKAFKYLCDQSSFDNDIDCLIVTGTMSGGTGEGPHMWNMVRMEDGRNYLVDVTNCDDGSIGAPDQLFMAYSNEKYTDGESGRETGYVIYPNGETISYQYDSDTLYMYDDDEIRLSETAYGSGEVGPGEEDEYTLTFTTDIGYLDLDIEGNELQEKSYKLSAGNYVNLYDYSGPGGYNGGTWYFAGWHNETTGEEYGQGDGFEINADMQLSAIWKRNLTITFDANGGYFKSTTYDPDTGEEIQENTTTVQQLHYEGEILFLSNEYDFPVPIADDDRAFAGWSLEKDGEPYPVNDPLVFTDNATMYAVWGEECTLTLTTEFGGFHSDNEEELVSEKAIRLPKGKTFYLSNYNPEYSGKDKVFLGWTDKSTGKIIDQHSEYTIKQDTELAARWASTFCATFDANGGYFPGSTYDQEIEDFVEDAEVVHERYRAGKILGRNGYVITPPVHRDSMLVFAGWSLEKNGEILPYEGEVFHEDVTLYAKWETGFTVTYHATDGYFSEYSDEGEETQSSETVRVYKNGSNAEISCVEGLQSPEGMSLVGWSVGEDGPIIYTSNDDAFVVNGEFDLYAVWKKSYNVTFDANGGQFFEEYFDEEITERSDTFLEGYVIDKKYDHFSLMKYDDRAFLGWSYEKDGQKIPVTDDGYVVDQDVTLYALWGDELTVTFDAQEGYYSDDEGNRVNEKKLAMDQGGIIYLGMASLRSYANPEVPEGKVFLGWTEDSDTEILDAWDYITITKNTTFHAVIVNEVTVTIDADSTNGGYILDWDETGEVHKDICELKYAKGAELDCIEAEIRNDNNLRLIGWKDAAGNWFVPGDTVLAGDITLYAQWAEPVEITLNCGGGTIEIWDEINDETQVHVATETYGLGEVFYRRSGVTPMFPKDKKSFVGWSFEDGTMIPDEGYTIDGPITFYAVWEDYPTVTFDPNGGIFEKTTWDPYQHDYVTTREELITMDVYPDYINLSSITIPTSSEGKDFLGWSLTPNGAIINEQDYLITGTTTFYAVWEGGQVITTPIEECIFSLSPETLIANGSNQYPEVTVKSADGTSVLKEGTDYEIVYPVESVNAGSYTITVTGLGNYTGEVNLSYSITEPTPVQTELEPGWFSLSRTSLIKNGDANQRPEVRVAEGAPALAEGVDYEVTAEAENVDDHGVGTYKLTVKGIGDYTGEIAFTYEITPAPAEGEIIAYPDGAEGTDAGEQEIEKEPGAPVELVVNAASGDGELTYAWYVHDEETGEDTLVTTENAEELGVEISTSDPGVLKTSANQAKTYRCVVTSGEKSKEVTYKVGVANGFVAAPKDTDPVEITDQNSTATLVVDASADNGALTYQWTDADGNVIAGETSSTLNTTQPGTYYCTVTDQYNNKKTVTFNVTSGTDPGTDPGTNPGGNPGTNPGGSGTPAPVMTKLNQTIACTVSALVTGQTKVFAVTGVQGALTCSSSKPAVATASVSGKSIVVNAVSVGTAIITVKAGETQSYKASNELKLSINVLPAATTSLKAENQAKGIKLTWAAVNGANGYIVYRNGAVVATIQGGATVKYVDKGANTNGAKYTFAVAAKAASGTSPLSTSIVTYKVARPSISSVKNTASKKTTVKWKKNSKATGYVIQYSLKKNFKSGVKKVTVKKKATVSKLIKSLKKGKTYYFRIQTYKKVGKDTYRSAWSAVKKLKIKK